MALLFKDLFGYIAPRLVGRLEDWDNADESMKICPRNKASHTSFGSCRAACEADKLCFQFVYDGSVCALSHHIRLGRKHSLEGDSPAQKYISGWNMERIIDWTSKTDCTSAHWVRSNP